MANVIFYCENGANCQSLRSQEIDTVEDLGLDEGEWEGYTEEERNECVEEWAYERLEIFYKAVE